MPTISRVGLVLDSFHICSRKTPLDAIRSIPGDRVFLVQMADAPILDMDVLSWSRHFRNFPGQGSFPLVDFARSTSSDQFQRFHCRSRSSTTSSALVLHAASPSMATAR